jgi:hypothetical protein
MACQDEALDALVEYDEENEGDMDAYLNLLTCARAGVLPLDCLTAAGLGDLVEVG